MIDLGPGNLHGMLGHWIWHGSEYGLMRYLNDMENPIMTGTFLNRLGAMDVFHTADPDVKMTDVLYGDITIIVAGVRYKGWIRFPITAIRKKGLGRWQVDPCEAQGWMDNGWHITVWLDAENDIGPLALPVKAQGQVGNFRIQGEYPWVLSKPEGGRDWKVGPVEAQGTVSTT
jgi:hypothetical protein